jgi:hypothetical protein
LGSRTHVRKHAPPSKRLRNLKKQVFRDEEIGKLERNGMSEAVAALLL